MKKKWTNFFSITAVKPSSSELTYLNLEASVASDGIPEDSKDWQCSIPNIAGDVILQIRFSLKLFCNENIFV